MLRPEGDATPPQVASLTAAISLWREVGLSTLSTGPGAPEVPVRFEAAASAFHGLYEPATGVVFINRGLEGSARDITVAHEVGHALGLPHVPREERGSVMNPGNLTVRPSLEDAAALQQRWSCPL